MTVKRRNREGYIDIDPTIPTVIALFIAAFVAGIFVYGMFFVPEQPDLRAEYCRGIADGDRARYVHIYNTLTNIENQLSQNGLTGGLATVDQEGNIIEFRDVVGEGAFFSPIDPEITVAEEASCNALPRERMSIYGFRGPTDEPPVEVTSPTTGE